MTLDLAIPEKLAINANHRLHYQARAQRTATIRHLAGIAAQAAHLTPSPRVHIVVHIGWPNRRRRDAHNIYPTLKACIDGIVDAGVIPDDSDRHLLGPDLRPYLAGERGVLRLRFEITPIPVEDAS